MKSQLIKQGLNLYCQKVEALLDTLMPAKQHIIPDWVQDSNVFFPFP